MKLKLKSLIFKAWIVGSLVWIFISLIRGGTWNLILLPPLVVGAIASAVVWVTDYYPKDPIDVVKLRRIIADALAVEKPEDSDYYRQTIEAAVNKLEADYGRKIPMRYVMRLQQILSVSISEAQAKRREIIDAAAKEGKVIEIDDLRDSIVNAMAPDTDPQQREVVMVHVDGFVAALREKYGTSIPIQDAFRIQQDFEEGRKPRPD